MDGRRSRQLGMGIVFFLASVLLLSVPAWSDQVTLTADSLRYDSESQQLQAEGHVRLTRAMGVVTADRGEALVSGKSAHFWGHVHGDWQNEGLQIDCEDLRSEESVPGKQVIEAQGHAVLVRKTKGERIAADYLLWKTGEDSYVARGHVLGESPSYSIDADEVGREGTSFWGKNVRRYENKIQKITLSANFVTGKLAANAIDQMEATGNVHMTLIPKSPEAPIDVWGDAATYSRAENAVVVTGHAVAVQNGRQVKAEKLVAHVDTHRIEALGGRPQITFTIQEKASPKKEKKGQ